MTDSVSPEPPTTKRRKSSFLDRIVEESTEAPSVAEKVYVYEAPLRLWHWVNALCITVLCVTGYLIGAPPPSLPGEASNSFLFGNIRMVHFAAGQIMAVFFIARIYWAFVGNSHAKQIFLLPLWSKKWWGEIVHEIKWYGFLTRDPKKYIGHNPLAQTAMFFLMVLPLIVQIFTGFA
ncbi:MAG: Ni/Fe-hydrogenase, b-type cytochrome subunit, partial [Pseudomonadota bacterium]